MTTTNPNHEVQTTNDLIRDLLDERAKCQRIIRAAHWLASYNTKTTDPAIVTNQWAELRAALKSLAKG